MYRVSVCKGEGTLFDCQLIVTRNIQGTETHDILSLTILSQFYADRLDDAISLQIHFRIVRKVNPVIASERQRQRVEHVHFGTTLRCQSKLYLRHGDVSLVNLSKRETDSLYLIERIDTEQAEYALRILGIRLLADGHVQLPLAVSSGQYVTILVTLSQLQRRSLGFTGDESRKATLLIDVGRIIGCRDGNNMVILIDGRHHYVRLSVEIIHRFREHIVRATTLLHQLTQCLAGFALGGRITKANVLQQFNCFGQNRFRWTRFSHLIGSGNGVNRSSLASKLISKGTLSSSQRVCAGSGNLIERDGADVLRHSNIGQSNGIASLIGQSHLALISQTYRSVSSQSQYYATE